MTIFQTNTFQMVLATDEVYTYAIFNYDLLKWSSNTEAGGDTTTGEGGVPAFVSLYVYILVCQGSKYSQIKSYFVKLNTNMRQKSFGFVRI